jgi:hypothetical protein
MCCYERDNKSRHLAIIPDEKRKEVLGEKEKERKMDIQTCRKKDDKKLY